MSIKKTFNLLAVGLLGGALLAGTGDVERTLLSTLTDVSPTPQSVGSLAFGPENILFVGDTQGGRVYAMDVADMERGDGGAVEVAGLDRKIASMLGIAVEDLVISDMAVHPTAETVYLSVMRGRGDGATPVLMRVSGDGTIQVVPFEGMSYSTMALDNVPQAGQRSRTSSITDLAYVDGEVFVAGLSNEEFASNVRRLPFPFTGEHLSTSLQIFHVSHGRNETNAPVMTFLAREIGNQTHLLAAYTCTPLVQFSVENLSDGEHVIGKTIAELGAGNRPLDMIAYEVNGQEHILISNSRHPLIKINPGDIPGATSLVEPTRETGIGFETVEEPGVRQMDNLNEDYVLILQQEGRNGPMNLRSLSKATL